MNEGPTADAFLERLEARRSDAEREKYRRYFKTGIGERDEGDRFIGVPMGEVFAVAAELDGMSLEEVERLLESPIHEARAGALRIMSRQARHRRTTEEHRRALYDLYRRRIDRINNWDLVDLAAWDVVGGYLVDRPRDAIDELARSSNPWERRTAILATLAFIRRDELDDTYRIAEVLLPDGEDLVQKGIGWALREAGKRDEPRLLRFLDLHGPRMTRTALRYAVERLPDGVRARYIRTRTTRL